VELLIAEELDAAVRAADLFRTNGREAEDDPVAELDEGFIRRRLYPISVIKAL
jgi:hypothetical protein